MGDESPPERKPGTRHRINSAKARLSTPPEQTVLDENRVMQDFKQRVQSAQQIRDAHTRSSKTTVFTQKKPKKGEKVERFSTSYSKDFRGSMVPPPVARPSSPTRRNNPHPTKQFMTWKVPSRTLGAPTGQLLGDSQKTFQADYLDDDYPDDPNDQILTSLSRLKFPPTQPSSKDYGQAMRKYNQAVAGGSSRPPSKMKQSLPQRQPLTSEILMRTVKGDSVNAFDTWLKHASSDEQHTVLKMLRSAEDSQLEDTMESCMQPAAAQSVKKWMKDAPVPEREVVARLLSAIGTRNRPPSREALPLHRSRSFSDGTQHLYSRPPTREQNVLPRPSSARSGSRLSRRPSAPTPLDSMRQPATQKQGPGVVWHQKAVRDPPPSVYHRGSIFGMPTHAKGSHFTIHPEWPEYYPTEDFVH